MSAHLNLLVIIFYYYVVMVNCMGFVLGLSKTLAFHLTKKNVRKI